MPAFHLGMLGAADEDRAVLNLGGIANLTLIPREGAVRGFDTGPANALMDAGASATPAVPSMPMARMPPVARWTRACWPAGVRTRGSRCRRRRAPGASSSTAWAEAHMGEGEYAAADVQATLLELTVATVADALLAQQPQTRRLLVCGGGVRNRQLMKRLAARLPEVQVESSAVHGLDPEYVEAMGFAWLAQRTMDGLGGNLPSVTGAKGPRISGAVHLA